MDKGEELIHTKRAYRNLFVKGTNPAGQHLVQHIEKLRSQQQDSAERFAEAGDVNKAAACNNHARAYKIVLEHISSLSKDPRR